MQGQLFSETVRSDQLLQEMLLPRSLALAERAWHEVLLRAFAFVCAFLCETASCQRPGIFMWLLGGGEFYSSTKS